MLRKGFFIAAMFLAAPVVAMATEYQIVERPRQECWNEQVPVRASSPDAGGAIIGGIAGGIIGNQVGKGNGRVVATAVGAMTGAIVGDRMSSPGPSYQYQTVRRCRTVMEQVQVPVAYPAPTVIYQRPMLVAQPVVEQRVYYVEDREYPRCHKHWKHHHHHDYDD